MNYPMYGNNQFYMQNLQDMRDRIDKQMQQIQMQKMMREEMEQRMMMERYKKQQMTIQQ